MFLLRVGLLATSINSPITDSTSIIKWSEEVETKIAMVDEDVHKLATFLAEVDQIETEKARKAQMEFEKELIERKFK